MLSFWEKHHLIHADVLIIGSGICGLSTAISIRKKSPTTTVTILERGLLPTGASTKNAGFACIGSLTEKQYDLKLMGENSFMQIIEDRWEGLSILRDRLGDDVIDFRHYGGYELITNEKEVTNDELDEMNQRLFRIFHKNVFRFANETIKPFGFKGVKQLIHNELEGQINTGKMMSALLDYAASLGVRVVTGAEVSHIETIDDHVEVILSNQTLTFTANQVALCTNAFTKQFLPEEEIQPGRGQVLVTSPIFNLKWKGIFHFDEGFYYFRNIENRILFGGGRNLDFEGETTTQFGLNMNIQHELERHLRETIIPNQDFEVTDRWSGIMAFGKDKLPLFKRVNAQMVVGARLNGMGIALGSCMGERLADMILQD